MPSAEETARIVVPFGWLEGEGMGLVERGMRREEVFAGYEASFEWEEAGGMRLTALVARCLAPALFDN
ncbi:MAG TPA: hypothetical protein VII86_06865 [Thermoanaerobaculia bacterium]